MDYRQVVPQILMATVTTLIATDTTVRAETPARGERLLTALLLLLVLVAPGVAAGAARTDGPPPNVILIVSDDAGYNEVGYTGPNDFLTPHMDTLAQSGFRFTQGYVTQAQCSPARAALMMSLYQQRFGYENNPDPIEVGDDGLDGEQVTLIEHFKMLGYATGVIGKWHLGAQIGVKDPIAQGADEFFGFIDGKRNYWFSPGDIDQRLLRRGTTIIEDEWPNEGDPDDYDPVQGRYLTDAFGDEAAAFIDAHAAEPFFLYVAFNAPHTPLHAKLQDLAMFPELTGNQQLLAAMMLALDRAIGTMVNALVANAIDQNTVIVFINDNGGRLDLGQDNFPFRGGKGGSYEGGIRVPFFVNIPWLAGDTDYDPPVAAIDLGPTLLATAGGAVPATDGVDLMPYITGQIQADPHDFLYFRHWNKFAIRDGDWKLLRSHSTLPLELYNVASDPAEETDLILENPAIAQALARELTLWEAQVLKPRWGPNGSLTVVNRFDHFRHGGVTGQWDDELAWFDATTGSEATMRDEDAYANAILEFPATAADYDAEHNMTRLTGLTFMLNQIRLTGDAVASGATATIHGNPLLFVDSLAGDLPEIQLGDGRERGGALAPEMPAADGAGFTFRLENDLQLLDDLRFVGSGPHDYVLSGTITEYEPGRTITKSGASTLTLAGDVSVTGDLVVNAGAIVIDGPDTDVEGLALAQVASGATLALAGDGRIQAPLVQVTGALTGQGTVNGTLESDGVVAPGSSFGLVTITGDYRQHVTGSLEIEIGGTLVGEFDRLAIDGTAELAGTLSVTEVGGFEIEPGSGFAIVTAGSVVGTFDTEDVPASVLVCYASDRVVLRTGDCMCFGDLDQSGDVGVSDFLILLTQWGPCPPEECPADLNGDGEVSVLDFLALLAHWGPCP